MDQGTSAVENVMLSLFPDMRPSLSRPRFGAKPRPCTSTEHGSLILCFMLYPNFQQTRYRTFYKPRLLLAFYIRYQLIGLVAAVYREKFSGECLGIQEKQQRPSVLTTFRRLRKPEAHRERTARYRYMRVLQGLSRESDQGWCEGHSSIDRVSRCSSKLSRLSRSLKVPTPRLNNFPSLCCMCSAAYCRYRQLSG